LNELKDPKKNNKHKKYRSKSKRVNQEWLDKEWNKNQMEISMLQAEIATLKKDIVDDNIASQKRIAHQYQLD